jgi:hypothetical protein
MSDYTSPYMPPNPWLDFGNPESPKAAAKAVRAKRRKIAAKRKPVKQKRK